MKMAHLRSPREGYVDSGSDAITALRMAEAAATWLSSLTREQRERALYPVESDLRLDWHYVPRERKGISLKEMNSSQQKLAHALISNGLSRTGYAKAMEIMSLEEVLKDLEGPARRFERDPDLYFITIFGNPSKFPWGWRAEGHHLSLNFLVVPGRQVAHAPNFFGANPAYVPPGSMLSGLRILAAEEDKARHVIDALDANQRTRALMNPEAPPDIVTGAERRVKIDGPLGLPSSEMSETQQRILMELLLVYIHRMPDDVAYARMEQIEKEGRKYIHFSWAGSTERGKPHYYRLHGPSFLIEYDNTQNNANHIHTVWRDLQNDWGNDLLKSHYQRSHKP